MVLESDEPPMEELTLRFSGRFFFYSKHDHKPQGTSVIPLGGVEKLLLQTSLQHQAE